MTGLTIHIEELVLHGFDPRQRHAIADAVHEELTRLLLETLTVEPEPSATDGSIEGRDSLRRLDAGAVDLEVGARPADAGMRLGSVIFDALRPIVVGALSRAAVEGATPRAASKRARADASRAAYPETGDG